MLITVITMMMMTSRLLQLIVNLVDMNDNVPMFPLSQYIVQGIAETVAVGTDIIQGHISQRSQSLSLSSFTRPASFKRLTLL